jgi:hypothetical protein
MMCVECLIVMLSAIMLCVLLCSLSHYVIVMLSDIMLCVSLCSVSDSVIVDSECHYAVCIIMFSVTFCNCYAE